MSYLLRNWDVVLNLVLQHVGMTGSALFIAAAIALPLGWALHPRPRLARAFTGCLGTIYTIPSIALIILLLPVFGLNARAVIAALILYNQVVLVRNVLAALDGIDPSVLEAARGMGMNSWQIIWRVQLPLALPVILAGVRVAAVVSVAIAAIGARFGAGGLGVLLFEGIAQAGRMDKIWVGALSAALLAGIISRGIKWIEHEALRYRR